MTAPAPAYSKPQFELADILRRFLPEYLKTHKLPIHFHKVLRAICNCRTAALNAHSAACDKCGHLEISYNSCRNRHCPKCQGSVRLKWLGNRHQELLPVPYYHCVFTLPHALNWLLMFNQKILYQLFFHKAFETMNSFAANPKHLGAQIGIVAVLHTWGQNLKYHVHLHLLVTGGGLSHDAKQWISPKYEHDFLFPVKALSKVFRGKFIEELEHYLHSEELDLPGELEALKHPIVWGGFKRWLHDSEWVVYTKKPFAGPEQVFEYVSRYTHRVAISNHRIKAVTDDEVRFEYKDECKVKIKKLSPAEFIGRYLRHILPFRFVRIRYGGFLAGAKRKEKLARCHVLVKERYQNSTGVLERFLAAAKRFFEAARRKFPQCEEGTLIFKELVAVDEVMNIISLLPGSRGQPVTGAIYCH